MDLVTKRHLLHVVSHGAQACPPLQSRGASSNGSPYLHPSSADFPIIAVIVIGIMATSFLLVSYYILVIKCCINFHHTDLARRLSLSMRLEEPRATNSPAASEPRGLDEAVIRLIPVVQYKAEERNRDFGERSICNCECAVCLNEFQENETLRIIPNCRHVFHIDCVDVWLQNNGNCPLCRISISFSSRFHVDQLPNAPRPSPQDQSPHAENLTGNTNNDEEFVVIQLENDQNLHTFCDPISTPNSVTKLEQRIVQKKARELHKVTSMGHECIIDHDRAKDDEFSVQTMRRSFSMDSSGNRKFYLTVQEALHLQNEHVNEVNSIEVYACGDSGTGSRAKRLSFFSLGHGSRSRSSVLPVYLDP